VEKLFILVFEKRHDVHDSASSFLRFMDRPAGRVGSGPRTAQILAGRVGLRFFRVGSQNLDPRATLGCVNIGLREIFRACDPRNKAVSTLNCMLLFVVF